MTCRILFGFCYALWIQCATHKDEEGCFVINTAHPDYADTAFTAKMPSAEAFMWLTQYPCGGFLPEGEIWEKKTVDRSTAYKDAGGNPITGSLAVGQVIYVTAKGKGNYGGELSIPFRVIANEE